MAEHTKGPWTWEANYHRPEITISGADGLEFATIDLDVIDPEHDDEAHADAHLIAAAPDLLSEGEAFYQAVRELEGVVIPAGIAFRLSERAQSFAAAIAKARGEGVLA